MGLPMGYVRSGTKDHGRQNQIEGRLEKGQKVVVVEDLISAGRSTEIYNVLGLDKLDCTVAMIQNADSKREHLTLPARVVDIIHCNNPRCITSTEQELHHEFRLVDREKKRYRCIYCESEAPLHLK